jgi:hypothetical protein
LSAGQPGRASYLDGSFGPLRGRRRTSASRRLSRSCEGQWSARLHRQEHEHDVAWSTRPASPVSFGSPGSLRLTWTGHRGSTADTSTRPRPGHVSATDPRAARALRSDVQTTRTGRRRRPAEATGYARIAIRQPVDVTRKVRSQRQEGSRPPRGGTAPREGKALKGRTPRTSPA